MIKMLQLIVIAGAFVASPAAAHAVPQSRVLETQKPYSPYEFLIGDWYSHAENMTIHQQFGWGPGKASMTYATYLDVPGQPQHLHFAGIMIWNGKTHAIDYLFGVEPGSGVEEKGTFTAGLDGSVVREVEATYPGGKVVRSRQIFHRSADGAVETDLLDQTPKGWVSSLPGGALKMTRTPPQ